MERNTRNRFAGIVTALLLILLAACGGPAETKPSAAGNMTEGEQTYRVGETAMLFDIKATVNEVTKTGDYHQQILKDGTEFVLVKVTLENAGAETKRYHYASFKLLSSGSEPDLNVTALDNGEELHEGELSPGARVTGIIPFEHPKNDPVMKLQFKPNPMSERMIEFVLK
ncbi:DUF4352 domain-containing protein [Cohnella sp. CFH 77786]|uniref:DUF4352 domain-containing protein n=1 Tax=Cohnella sp. CFH 77786 TaxID=2662265 RepID=UPI001C60AFE1|nr:DUF4352 domain-containing protein [Cohnella sp. CFH 77786]MBW5447501.1 DUF4352 domain-containing protein [Cohnella sp. CFH 77786]